MADKTDKLAQQQKAKRLHDKGLTYAAIAAAIGVSVRTVERWGAAGGWAKQSPDAEPEKAQVHTNVVEMATAEFRSGSDRPRRNRRDSTLDEIAIVEDAIWSLSGLLCGGEGISVNSPGVGSTASALVRLLEYRRKIAPPTAADLAEQAIALGYSPQEFAAELRRQWQQPA